MMRKPTTATGVVVILVALACPVPAAPALAQLRYPDLTIHSRACPVTYDGPDFSGECRDDPISSVPFAVEGPDATRTVETVADGNVTFRDLTPGAYRVRGGPPVDLVRSAVFCAPASSLGTPYPFRQISADTITLELSVDQDVICDWYSAPKNLGTVAAPIPAWTPPVVGPVLTVVGLLCPTGYDGNDYAAVCADYLAGGALFRLAQTNLGEHALPKGGDYATADADGVVKFALGSMTPGTVSLHLIPPAGVAAGGFTVPLVSCLAAGDNSALDVVLIESRAAGQIVEVELGAGKDIACDVYFLPLALSSRLPNAGAA